jgi:TrpR-related protein YerC/YecD
MKIKPRRVKNKDRTKYLDTLYTAVASLKSREEVKNFLRDLLTESERIMLGRRILIAKNLLENKTYDQIVEELHVGLDTITRVHKWLEDEFDGYERVLRNLEKEFESRFKRKSGESYAEPFSFSWLRKKYPLYFLLFNLLAGKSEK